jgi:hypothetical protein
MLRSLAVFFCCAAGVLAAPFACETHVPAPAYVRPEGLTELMSDIGLVCDGDVPAQGIQADIDLYFNTNAIGSVQEGAPVLLVGEGKAGWKLDENVIAGVHAPPNRIRWPSIRLAPAGIRGPFRFRFVNLRISAAMIGTSQTLRPSKSRA